MREDASSAETGATEDECYDEGEEMTPCLGGATYTLNTHSQLQAPRLLELTLELHKEGRTVSALALLASGLPTLPTAVAYGLLVGELEGVPDDMGRLIVEVPDDWRPASPK